MSCERQVPYAVMNYRELIKEDFFFVDHTRYLRELEKYKTPVFLRPKRFGKSLWVSMLEHYYDVRFKDQFRELFGKTEIGKAPTPLAGSFLVLSLDFSTITLGTVAEIEESFTIKLRGDAETFCVLHKELCSWPDLSGVSRAAEIVNILRQTVQKNGLPPLYVIIDEYDNFTNGLITAGRDADYDAICGRADGTGVEDSFFKAFFKALKEGLKDGTVGRTYFTGVLPITLDDLSSGYNVGEIVNLDPQLVGMLGFSQDETERYVGEIFDAYGFDPAKKPVVLADLKSFYDGYSFVPAQSVGPLYNSTICNWYLNKFVKGRGAITPLVIDTNVRTDIKWFRRLAQTNENAVARMREYFDQGQTESVSLADLMPRFRRIHPLSPEYLPILLYYLGWLTFVDDNLLGCPNLYTQKLFDSLVQDPNWTHGREVEVVIVEVAGNRGYNWHTLQA